MKVESTHWRTIWPEAGGKSVGIIDQTLLPHRFETVTLRSLSDAADAIRRMKVRGAPLIGATAAYGLALALMDDPTDEGMATACAALEATRPTAVNLRWAVRRVAAAASKGPAATRAAAAWHEAAAICDEDIATNRAIGMHGLEMIRALARSKRAGDCVNILTHCNAGWLATVDHGTALAPVYAAHDAGIPVRVWVDETRPRNQGASLTVWELAQHGVPHTLIVDNAGGHLMQHGRVDCCIVGTDRTAANGDVANKIGTYLKALAATDNGVPFYVALPGSTIDWSATSGAAIPIEERSASEVREIAGIAPDGREVVVRITPPNVAVANPAFDVTPARLVTGLITERGVCEASARGLRHLFPESARSSQ